MGEYMGGNLLAVRYVANICSCMIDCQPEAIRPLSDSIKIGPKAGFVETIALRICCGHLEFGIAEPDSGDKHIPFFLNGMGIMCSLQLGLNRLSGMGEVFVQAGKMAYDFLDGIQEFHAWN